MKVSVLSFVGLLAIAFGSGRAAPTMIQPDEAASKDALIYEFLPTFNFNGDPFGPYLSTGSTGIGHDTQSFIQFDLTGTSLGAGEIATLNLWVGSAADIGFGLDPTAANPVKANLYYNTSDWTESTVSWNSRPTAAASLVGQVTINHINDWISFDVTSTVQDWLANVVPNYGFTITQDAVVGTGMNLYAAVYDSSAGAHLPYLQIVPEPASLSLIALASLLVRRRHRRN